MEFAMVRSSPQRFDCVLSIVVWCGVLPHHHTQGHVHKGTDSLRALFVWHFPGGYADVLRVATSRNARNRPLSLPEPSLFSVWAAGRLRLFPRQIHNLRAAVQRQPRPPVTSTTRRCASFVLTLRQLIKKRSAALTAVASSPSARSARLGLRATPEQEAVLRRAAEVAHKSLTDFILDSACLAAEQTLLDQRLFMVSGS